MSVTNKKNLRYYLLSNSIFVRMITSALLLLVIFFSVLILSYYLLPDGFLAKKNSVSGFEASQNIWACSIQIFLFNMISVVFIIIGSLFSKRKDTMQQYMGYGYYCFFLLVMMNAVTLGTWSFSSETESVPLIMRIIGIFYVTKNAGLIEMIGQMLIACSLANKSLVQVEPKETHTKKIRELSFDKSEICVLIFGFVLMYFGAYIESKSILG